jgi:SAM-dependent methyltransferase
MEEYVNYLTHLKAYEEAASMAQGKSVLDWGCNNGYGIEVMRSLGCRDVAGIDLNPRAIASARSRLGDGIELILFDGKQTSLAAERFDVVTSFQCIEHVVDQDAYLTQIRRVLKAGGIAIFTTPNAAIRLDPGMKPWNEFHVIEFLPSELHALLSKYFSAVTILGLFGNEELQQIEIDRCDRARQRARLGEPPPDPTPSVFRRLARRLAGPLVDRFRKTRVPPGPPLRLPDHSTAELLYKQTDMESALDLMAICRK